MNSSAARRLLPYTQSLAGTLLAAREAVMSPIRAELRRVGVTEQQWRVLRVLNEEPVMDAVRIAQAALLHAPSVTRILKELDERRLIERTTDARDARRLQVSITASGKALIEQTASHTLVHLDSYAAAFGRERLDSLRDELTAFIRTLEALARDR